MYKRRRRGSVRRRSLQRRASASREPADARCSEVSRAAHLQRARVAPACARSCRRALQRSLARGALAARTCGSSVRALLQTREQRRIARGERAARARVRTHARTCTCTLHLQPRDTGGAAKMSLWRKKRKRKSSPSTVEKSRSPIRAKSCSPPRAIPSSISSTTTSPSPTVPCAALADDRTSSSVIRTASPRSSFTKSARPSRGLSGWKSSRYAFPQAARRKRSSRARPRRLRGWPTSPAWNCIRTPFVPRIWIIRTSCAWTSIRSRAWSGGRCRTSRPSSARRCRTSV